MNHALQAETEVRLRGQFHLLSDRDCGRYMDASWIQSTQVFKVFKGSFVFGLPILSPLIERPHAPRMKCEAMNVGVLSHTIDVVIEDKEKARSLRPRLGGGRR